MYFKEETESEMSVLLCVYVWCVYECFYFCAIREVRDNFVESPLATFTYKTNLGSCQPVWQTPFSSCVISLALCLGFWDSLSVSQTDLQVITYSRQVLNLGFLPQTSNCWDHKCESLCTATNFHRNFC